MKYYGGDASGVLEALESTEQGLTRQEAAVRLKKFGVNKLRIKGRPFWHVVLEPFIDLFVLVLLAAAVLSFLTGHVLDAVIIAVIIAINAVIFYVQSWSTSRVLRALKQQEVQTVHVYRDGEVVELDSSLLVPGDVVSLSEGEKVPADGRVLSVDEVKVDESQLTGESLPVEKSEDELPEDTPIYEQVNMLFDGSFVLSGRVTYVVTATGESSEFGKLAALATPSHIDTSPAQKKINKLTTQLIVVTTIVSVLVFGLALLRGVDVLEALRFVMSLTVSAVPEGLPVAIAVVLVLGMRQLARYKALVRSMRAVENIGIVTTIATDKTGTLTQNKLAVKSLWEPYETDSEVDWLKLSVNDVEMTQADPLDMALIDYVKKQKVTWADELEFVDQFPFDQELAMSGSIWRTGQGRYHLALKGAPEKVIVASCHDDETRRLASEALSDFTKQGYRVIGLAKVPDAEVIPENLAEANGWTMQFIGLVAIADELRPEAKKAIKEAQAAGISVRMITGDHADTAYAIGKELGLAKNRSEVLDCRTIDTQDDEIFASTVAETTVFARVLPQVKHRIVGVLKKHEVAAMTGDGVNDVPALTHATIGIAMGSGSQIAKEAADIVLVDDNFATIIKGVAGGRVIFDNIRRMLYFLLSTNLGEILTMVIALLVGLPLPVVAVQILWINLVTDTAFGIPLGLEPAEDDVMKRPPRSPKQPILEHGMLARIGFVGSSVAIVTLAQFAVFYEMFGLAYAQTIAFTVLVVAQWANALSARSESRSFMTRLRVRNMPFVVGFVFAIASQIFVLYGPLASVFHVVPIHWEVLVLTGGVGFILVLVASEVAKRLFRH